MTHVPPCPCRFSDSAVGRLILNYRFCGEANFHASVSRRRKQSVISANACAPEDGIKSEVVDVRKLRAETADSGEIGLEGSIGRSHFMYDASAFYYK